MSDSAVMDAIVARAQAATQVVALPESTDPRTLQAARRAADDRIADIVLVGSADQIADAADEQSICLDGMEIVEPHTPELLADNAALFYERRKHKGISHEQAEETVRDPLYCASLLLAVEEVNATVAGAINSTADVLRPLFQVVGTAHGMSLASSCFLMVTAQTHMGAEGAFIFADAGVVPDPTAAQLADIAIASAESARTYMQVEPHVAMLSFSTMGSAYHPRVHKVVEATRIAQQKRPDLLIDGELQADAALVPEVAAAKCEESRLQGRANVLIFPDLNSGNIAYKLVQRLADAKAYGPLLQGLAKVGMDLSRGATADDIYHVIALAVVRSTTI